jgi:hypothetical protein
MKSLSAFHRFKQHCRSTLLTTLGPPSRVLWRRLQSRLETGCNEKRCEGGKRAQWFLGILGENFHDRGRRIARTTVRIFLGKPPATGRAGLTDKKHARAVACSAAANHRIEGLCKGPSLVLAVSGYSYASVLLNCAGFLEDLNAQSFFCPRTRARPHSDADATSTNPTVSEARAS